MAQLAALPSLSVDSVVAPRPGVLSRIDTGEGSLTVDTCGRRISFPSHVSAAVRFALTGTEFIVKDLPGNLDDPGKLTLVRRLIREGLLLALPA